MGVLRRIWGGPGRRPAGAVVLVALAVGGAVACEPGGLSSATVAYTTDETVTRELERRKADVRWLTCTASFGDDGGSAPAASEDTVADVDCEGETSDGREITVDGKVTRAVNGRCVRGDLVAKVDGREWFHVRGLGDCDAPGTPPVNQPPGGPGPQVTVTVTRTVWCQSDPQCWPQGK
ncbi:hypothetical protein [Streptomyces glaucescens]|uniref:Lipoprotein n=1 Tax=Streptomyces glaucescens TaxID=1907 RepID=A0A089XB10_STRGA|nr:hypothetical protein [Streptomyces glaucescens]AIR98324.1 lipoprotein [Streptomyces glaucescens]